ncbi:MAG: polysulfide reductase NrfD [Bacteroidales bacterium]|nr:polysulfide reductase NrfD [Bacteroidales bacterium]MBK7173879.1 polysulfide reductase NrfD [Bacteroidales bacterium]
MYKAEVRGPLILGDKNYSQITSDIIAPIDNKTPTWWKVAMGISVFAALWGMVALYYTVRYGLGTWAVNNSVAWGWEIINFVWWIGIGHAGTAFSIFLLILRQKWRTSINRAAEAMTVFAVICAAIFPAIHMGRVWLAFYIFPYPNTRGPLWVNFNSPLFWDFIAISAYLLISASFWYFGMVPDFASIRDKATNKVKKAVYGLLAFGWTGSSREWLRYEGLSYVLGGIAAVLVVSVHSIVSTDFASSVIPGWHTTLFPPYFVVGAIFSGFAMVMTLMIVIRKFYSLEQYVTDDHLNAIARILVFISLIMGTAYATEVFIAWYGGNEYEMFTFFKNRVTGTYTFMFWAMITCNAIIPQLMWSKKIRSNITALFIISLIINLGMWYERYNIVVTSLAKDYLPSSWTVYSPTWVEIGIYIGTLGIFVTGVLLFFRFIPMIAISEVKSVLKPTSLNKYSKTH